MQRGGHPKIIVFISPKFTKISDFEKHGEMRSLLGWLWMEEAQRLPFLVGITPRNNNQRHVLSVFPVSLFDGKSVVGAFPLGDSQGDLSAFGGSTQVQLAPQWDALPFVVVMTSVSDSPCDCELG